MRFNIAEEKERKRIYQRERRGLGVYGKEGVIDRAAVARYRWCFSFGGFNPPVRRAVQTKPDED
jgi:hypothetical protein